MKKILFILMFFCQVINAQIQDSTQKNSINIEIGPTIFGAYLTPYFSKRFLSHEIELGVLFRHTDYDSPWELHCSGIDFGYFYYPNIFGKKFDFYFCLDNKIEKIKAHNILGEEYLYSSANEFKAFLYRFSAGYGFRKVFIKRFYFATDIGIGRMFQRSYSIKIASDNFWCSRISLQTRVKLGIYLR
jgi:hypothetical protein